ncbi:hypothetical protein D3C81_2174150 [compost metagenome]
MPAVATSSAGQNRSIFDLTTANTAGSEPSGNRVAETKLMMKTESSPTSGAATVARTHWTALSTMCHSNR